MFSSVSLNTHPISPNCIRYSVSFRFSWFCFRSMLYLWCPEIIVFVLFFRFMSIGSTSPNVFMLFSSISVPSMSISRGLFFEGFMSVRLIVFIWKSFLRSIRFLPGYILPACRLWICDPFYWLYDRR